MLKKKLNLSFKPTAFMPVSFFHPPSEVLCVEYKLVSQQEDNFRNMGTMTNK